MTTVKSPETDGIQRVYASDEELEKMAMAAYLLEYNNTELSITVPERDLKAKQILESCPGRLQKQNGKLSVALECFSACGHWGNLTVSPLEKEKGINILSRLEELIPNKEALIIETFGAVAPIPRSLVTESFNTYSQADKAAWMRFGKTHQKNPDYDILDIPSLARKEEKERIEGDHDFQGKTYQEALREHIADFRSKYKIYNPKTV